MAVMLRNIPRFNFTLFHLIASFMLISEEQFSTIQNDDTGIEAVEALNPPFPSPHGFTNRQEHLLSCQSVRLNFAQRSG